MYQYNATIVRVIDGDTAVCDVDLGFYICLRNIHFRLYGIDTPEKSDRFNWQAATDFTKKFFTRCPTVIVNVHGQDKYGRWLGEFIEPNSETTLNDQLIAIGLAKIYEG